MRPNWHSILAFVFLAPCLAHGDMRSAGAPVPHEEYVFVQDLNRLVAVFQGKNELVGTLDADGNFLQLYRHQRGASVNHIPPSTPINFVLDKPKDVLEFRTGRLIKGQMTPKGSFVPELGSKVIRFEDYRYGPGATPIWNLPGYFKRVDRTRDSKDAKK